MCEYMWVLTPSGLILVVLQPYFSAIRGWGGGRVSAGDEGCRDVYYRLSFLLIVLLLFTVFDRGQFMEVWSPLRLLEVAAGR